MMHCSIEPIPSKPIPPEVVTRIREEIRDIVSRTPWFVPQTVEALSAEVERLQRRVAELEGKAGVT